MRYGRSLLLDGNCAIAAIRNNGIGTAGVAPDAKILPVEVLENGSGPNADIAAGVRRDLIHSPLGRCRFSTVLLRLMVGVGGRTYV